MPPARMSTDAHRPSRYSATAQAIHWCTAILVLVAFLYGPGGSEQRVYAIARDADRQLHETLGLTVFALVVFRVLWRLVDVRPDPVPVTRWMGIASKAVQNLLYLLLFAVPMTAMSGAWLEGHPLTLLGGLSIPSPLPLAHASGALLATVHTWLGDTILWTAGLHALAALFHQFILRDGVLRSMLPGWLLPSAPGAD
jgi:cytochrome b561